MLAGARASVGTWATTLGILGREGDLFRYVIRWSIGMILFMCVLVYLQSTPVLGWMLP